METADDIARLTTEIVNLTLAARSFEEATSEMRCQRDEAHRAAAALRRWVWLAASGMALALLFAIVMMLSFEAAEDASLVSLEPLVRIDRTAAEKDALRVERGAVLSVRLAIDDDCIVYRVDVAGGDGQTHEVLVNASDGTIVRRECGDTGTNSSDDR